VDGDEVVLEMTKEQLQKVIGDEIKFEPDIKNVFGVDLASCLIIPVKECYFDDKNMPEMLWTVLEENSGGEGYTIYFDDVVGSFGLGMRSPQNILTDLGLHGTFLQTLSSM
jgi:hypothetical protein